MLYSQLLAHVATILALSSSIVNPGTALADSSLNSANISQNTTSSTVQIVPQPVVTPDPKPDRLVSAVVTAYTSTPGQTDDSPFIGARGTHVYDGMIAVNDLPFGTKIKIPELFGDKVFTVDDRMNRRYSCQTSHCNMDVWMDTTVHEARVFGLHHVTAEIYYPDSELATK